MIHGQQNIKRPLLSAQFTILLFKITESKSCKIADTEAYVSVDTIWSHLLALSILIPHFSKIHRHSHPQVYLCTATLLFINEMGLLSSVILYRLEIAKYAADTFVPFQ
jgi:hypothetical protein